MTTKDRALPAKLKELYSSIALWLIAWAHRWPAVSDRFIGYNYNLRPHLTAGDVTVVLVVISVAVLPPAVLLGMSFPVTQKAIQDDPALVGQRVGLIQVFNILGNTAGAIVTGLVLMQVLGTPGSIRLLALLGLLFTLVLLADGHRRVIRPLLQLAHSSLAGGLAVVLVTFPSEIVFWSRLHAVKSDEDVIVGEDRTGITLLNHDTLTTGLLYIGGHAQSNVPFAPIHAGVRRRPNPPGPESGPGNWPRCWRHALRSGRQPGDRPGAGGRDRRPGLRRHGRLQGLGREDRSRSALERPPLRAVDWRCQARPVHGG
jgi:hypothetical protein